MAGLLVEGTDELGEPGLGDGDRVTCDRELLACGGAIPFHDRLSRREARGRAACPSQLRLERVELERGGVRPSLERLVVGAQRRDLRVRAGGVRGQRDRNRGDQQEARENGSETRRIARRMRPHEARTVASFGSKCDCL